MRMTEVTWLVDVCHALDKWFARAKRQGQAGRIFAHQCVGVVGLVVGGSAIFNTSSTVDGYTSGEAG